MESKASTTENKLIDSLDSAKNASKWSTINGVQLHYTCRGTGLHPLLLIPGALGVGEQQYRPQLDYFGRDGSGFKVVTFDPRGYGESDVERPERNSFITDALDGHQLMSSLSLPKFSVLALCSGGRAGLALASIFPQSVRSLVVFGTRSYITQEEVDVYERIRDVSVWDPKIRGSLESIYRDSLQKKWSACLDELQSYLAASNGDICTRDLANVFCSMLIIHGAEDAYTPLCQAEYLRDHVKESQLYIMEKGRHMLHLKQHGEFNKIVEDFLNTQHCQV